MITADRAALAHEESLVESSLADLREDFDELAHLAGSMRRRVDAAGQEVRGAATGFHRSTRRMVAEDLDVMATRLERFRKTALTASTHCSSASDLDDLTTRRASLAETLRPLVAQAATLIVASDWQSASFAHAVHSSAGRYEGRITEHHDDYKRDRHADAAAFELAYLREYVEGSERLGLRALMTNCGMAAFTTILAFLETDRRIDGPVVAGRATYHECLGLLARSRFASRLVLVDETDTEEILRVLVATRPVALFLDSLCNARAIAVPEIAAVMAVLARRPDPVYLVIDNTGLSCAFRAYARHSARSRVRILLFESLSKYPQFGLDRTTAGMIVAPAEDADELDARREHLGTNVTDTSVHVIPWPDRARLERRLARLGRNTGMLATILQALADAHAGSALRSVTHPGLPGHPSHRVVRGARFRGGYLSLELDPRFECDDGRAAFLRLSLEEAERRGVPLAAGASFGLDTTRIYVTASNSDPQRAFVRISPGTEHRLQMEALGDVFESALRRLAADHASTERASATPSGV